MIGPMPLRRLPAGRVRPEQITMPYTMVSPYTMVNSVPGEPMPNTPVNRR